MSLPHPGRRSGWPPQRPHWPRRARYRPGVVSALAAAAGAVALAPSASAFDRTFNVSVVGSYNPPIAAAGNHYADLARKDNLVALGSVAGDGVVFVDISNIASPSFLSYYNPLGSAGGHFQDIEFKGNYAFCALDDSGSANGGIHVLNIANPTSPVKVAEITQAQSGFHRNHTVFLDGNYLYAASNQISTVKVFDVSNPASPVFVRDIVTGGAAADNLHQVTVQNGRLYTSNITNGLLEIYNVADVGSGSWSTATRKLGSFATTVTPGVTAGRNHSSWPSQDGSLVAVAHETGGGDVQLWNIANPAAPFMVSRITGASAGIDGYSPHNPVIVGDTMYVTWYQAGLQIFNIRDAANPVHLGAYDTFVGGNPGPTPYLGAYDGNWGLDVSLGNDRILLSQFDDGLHVVDATNAFRKVWTNAADASWQENARWSGGEGGGPFPNSSEMTASFTNPDAGTTRIVTVDGAHAPARPRAAGIEMLKTLGYTLTAANGGEIELRNSQGPATVTLLDGVGLPRPHAVNAPLVLEDDLVVSNHAPDNNEVALDLATIRAAGRTITFQGTGHTAVNGANPAFTGSVIVDGGRLRLHDGQAVNAQPIILAGGQLMLRNGASTDFGSDVNVTETATLTVGTTFGGTATSHRIGALTVAAGKTLTLVRGGVGLAARDVTLHGTLWISPAGTANTQAFKVETLATPGAGRLDLAQNGAVVIAQTPPGTWTGATYDGVAGMIRAGRNNGAWNGPGIVTSHPDALSDDDLITVGVASASQVLGILEGAAAAWLNQTVTGSDTLARVTYGGDATLDGQINIDDYGRIDANVAQSGSVFGWYNGDFNYDGAINIDDYGIIDGNIGRQGALTAMAGDGGAAVPEPGGLGSLLTFALVARRRRESA